MKIVVWCMAMLAFCSSAAAWGGGIARIADGDCQGLAAAAAAPPGQEPSLIVLARNGHYGVCEFTVNGTITIDGAGASVIPSSFGNDSSDGVAGQFVVTSGAHLTIRQLNFTGAAIEGSSTLQAAQSNIGIVPGVSDIFVNRGTLVLDTVSVFNVGIGVPPLAYGLVFNFQGDLVVRNTTIDHLYSLGTIFHFYGGSISVSGSTLTNNNGYIFYTDDPTANISVSNSIFAGNRTGCFFLKGSSLGGNVTDHVTDDTSCFVAGATDRVVSDVHLLDVGTHGGVVNSIALRSDSPAIGAGVASQCEATDARGYSRGKTTCDAGAYEFGGGVGHIGETGMSGAFYDPQHDGHYVFVQRLHDETGACHVEHLR